MQDSFCKVTTYLFCIIKVKCSKMFVIYTIIEYLGGLTVKHAKSLMLTLCLVFSLAVFSSTPVHATEIQDSTVGVAGENSSGAVTDFIKGYTPVTNENMANASQYASPIVTILGNLTGALLILGVGAIAFVTACDLLYISVPFLRGFLCPPQGRRYVSDEAVACIPQQGGGNGSVGASGGMNSGAFGGMNGMGGSSFGGGMGGSSNTQQEQKPKSIILSYFKSRLFFVVIFVVATIVLTSSLLLDCGINIGELVLRIVGTISNGISGINM